MEEEKQELVLPKDSLVFIPMGGSSEIGMNFFAYGYQGKWLIVDCGLGFPGDNLPGVDLLVPDASFIAQYKKDIVALLITHGHEDHIGAIPYLWKDLQCPIYTTAFTGELIEGKLDEANLLGRADLNIVDMDAELELPPFKVRMVSSHHSIPEPNMLLIETKEGRIVHTGDWRFDKPLKSGKLDNEDLLKEIGKKGVLALVCDSTNVFVGENQNTELDVRENLKRIFAEQKGRIVVTCFASNVARIESIYEAAKSVKRKVCLMGRSLWRIDSAARATGYLKGVPEFLTEEESLQCKPEEIVYICTGSQGESHSALLRLAVPAPLPNQPQLSPGDTVIFSSRVIPGNELAIASVQKRLMSLGCRIIINQETLVHVSGHPSADQMAYLYRLLKPQIAIPVHGDPLQIAEHKKLAQSWGAKVAITVEEGDVVELNDGQPNILGQVPVGCMAVDGKKIIPLKSEVIKKRRKMLEGGTVVATLVVDKDGHFLTTPQISSFGLIENEQDDQQKLIDFVQEKIGQISEENLKKDQMINETARSAIRQFISEYYGKKPLIEIHLLRL
ncbi:MAG: ribonuclease J [Alphaproteobacteria bacterium]|nr:ribonuclease J [Alphaproteobacteria bacterium]